jgi:DNA-binding response OmpR family regulator
MPVRRILIVEDDPDLQEALGEQLAQTDTFEVRAVTTGNGGLEVARNERIDLIVMDVGLPDMSGRDAVRTLRDDGFSAPIIMLTASDSEADTVAGLEAGADDYVTKPFRYSELLARIRAQLRQHERSDDAVFSVGRYSFQPSTKVLVDTGGRRIRLTEKETAILKFLYRAGSQPVPREVLLAEVWGYNAGVTTHTLETHVYRLRQKIERDPAHAEILTTEGGGYRLMP